MKTLLSLCLALLVSASPGLSQGLTGNQVERFLNSIEKLNQIPESEDDLVTDFDADPKALQERMISPFTSSLPQMRTHKMYSKGIAIIKNSGFSSDVEWASVGDRTVRAYAALKMGEVEPEMDEKMAKALADVEKSDLPEEMKQRMRDAMAASTGMVKTMQDVPAGDVEAVKPHLERLESLGERETVNAKR